MKEKPINKKQRIVRRLKNISSIGAKVTQKQVDVELIDLVLKKLYNNGDKQTASLEDDILTPAKVNFTKEGFERLWDILISTGLVNSTIGFGRLGKLSLSMEGYQLMRRFDSYSSFIKKREEESQKVPDGVMPQFIISTSGEERDENSKEEEKTKKVAKSEESDFGKEHSQG